MKISYIPKNSEDLKVIAKWYFEEWGYLSSSTTEKKIFEGLSSKLKKDNDFLSIITVHEHGELVAVADLKYREHKDYPEYEHWLGGIFVKLECRGKGYAAALINKAKEHVNRLSIPALYLQCEEHNIGLYRKYNFKELHSAVHSGVKTTIFKYDTSTD